MERFILDTVRTSNLGEIEIAEWQTCADGNTKYIVYYKGHKRDCPEKYLDIPIIYARWEFTHMFIRLAEYV